MGNQNKKPTKENQKTVIYQKTKIIFQIPINPKTLKRK